MNKICYIVGAAEIENLDITVSDGDLLIAADGGYLTLLKKGFMPDVIIGDFDSSPRPEVKNVEIIALKPEKDYTDIAEAIDIGKKRGYTEFVISGCLGGRRLSHTVANLALIAKLASEKLSATLIGDNVKIYAVSRGSLSLKKGCTYLSIFAFGGKAEVSLSGVKYPLSHYKLICDTPLGVSNEITAETAEIRVHSGTALVIEEF